MRRTTINQMYTSVTFGTLQPNIVLTTPRGYTYIQAKFAPQQEEEEEEDSFLTWVSAVRTEAKKPKNHELRKFLAANRWERR